MTKNFIKYALLSVLTTLTLPVYGQEHPYLFFDSGDLPGLIADANDGTHERSAIFQTLMDEVEAQGADCPTHGLTAYALAYVITGEPSYAESVRQRLLALAGQVEWEGGERDRGMAEILTYFAIAFDLTYDYLAVGSGFDTIRDKLALETFKMYEAASSDYDAVWRNWWRTSYSQNHFHRDVGSEILGALALKYEGNSLTDYTQADVDTWIGVGIDLLTKNQAALDGITDGSWHEGNMYEETTVGIDLPHPLVAIRRVEGLDLISSSPWLQTVPKFWIYNMAPPSSARSRLTQYGDSGSAWWRQNGILPTLRLCASEYNDPYAQWAADENVATNGRDARFNGMSYTLAVFYEFVYYDDSVEALSPDTVWAESWLAADLGVAFMRTGWAGEGLHAALKCGAYAGHTLFEIAKVNSIWNGDMWVNADYPVGGDQGAYPQDMDLVCGHDHPDNNGFYIYGNGVYLAPEAPGYDEDHGSPWGRYTYSHNTILVDGRGQVGDGVVGQKYGNDREDFFESDGTISTFAPTENFDLSVGDATRTYPRFLELTEFVRHFFYLKPDYFVVFDTLNANAPKTYDWTCHVPDEVAFEGPWIRGAADDGNVLGIYVVSPESYTTETGIVGPQVSFRFLDPDEEISFFRLGVTDAQEIRFITVLYPTTDSGWADRPEITKIAETDSSAGVLVTGSDGSTDAVLCAYHGSGAESIGSNILDGLGGVVRRDADGSLLSVYVAEGSSLEEDGVLLVEMPARTTSFEASYSGSSVVVSGEGIVGFTLFAPDAVTLTVNGEPAEFDRDGDYLIYPAEGADGAETPEVVEGEDAVTQDGLPEMADAGEDTVGDDGPEGGGDGCGCRILL